MTRVRPSLARLWLSQSGRRFLIPGPGLTRRSVVRGLTDACGYGAMLAKWRLQGLPARGTVVAMDRHELLDSAAELAPRAGLWLEFGVWRGESINHIAQHSGRAVVGFDSFEGFPHGWFPSWPAGTYSTGGDLPEVLPQVSLVKGWFDQTLPVFLEGRPNESVAFVHVDCDLYSSTRTVLAQLGRRIATGTVVVFDEFSTVLPDDESRAWREFCRSHRVRFRWLGCSVFGAVALQVTSAGRAASIRRDVPGDPPGGQGSSAAAGGDRTGASRLGKSTPADDSGKRPKEGQS